MVHKEFALLALVRDSVEMEGALLAAGRVLVFTSCAQTPLSAVIVALPGGSWLFEQTIRVTDNSHLWN